MSVVAFSSPPDEYSRSIQSLVCDDCWGRLFSQPTVFRRLLENGRISFETEWKRILEAADKGCNFCDFIITNLKEGADDEKATLAVLAPPQQDTDLFPEEFKQKVLDTYPMLLWDPRGIQTLAIETPPHLMNVCRPYYMFTSAGIIYFFLSALWLSHVLCV